MQVDALNTECQNKIVTALTLEAGQSLETEELQYQLDCISEDGNCPCNCDYSTDKDCKCRDLQGSISITVTKTDAALLYPLIYARTVNYYPIEIVRTGASISRLSEYFLPNSRSTGMTIGSISASASPCAVQNAAFGLQRNTALKAAAAALDCY